MDQTLASVEEEKQNQEGVYAEEAPTQEDAMAMQEQIPSQGQSPLTYKKRNANIALQLLKKYSK